MEKLNEELLNAAKRGDLLTVERCLESGANIKCTTKTDYKSPLHLAAENGCTDMASYLIAWGADINSQDKYIKTPIHLALQEGHTDTAALLISREADINIKDCSQQTPLDWALQEGQEDIATLLINKGAEVNIMYGGRVTPIQQELQEGHTDTVSEMDSINVHHNNKQTPIHCSADKGKRYAKEVFLSREADIDSTDVRGRTPLHQAAREGNTDATAFLLSQGAAINIKDNKQQTPLHLAAEKGFTNTVALMISWGADINLRDDMKRTPLHWASREGHTETVALLLSQSADINVQDNINWTTLHLATQGCRLDTAALLISYGADTNIADELGLMALVKGSDKEKIVLQKLKELEKQEQILKELRGLGMETADDFQDIMKKGTYKCFWNRIYLVGPCSVGKSTLAKILVGDPIPTDRKSTDGIWIYMGRAGMDVDRQEWKFFPKGTAIKEIISGLLMSVTYQGTQDKDWQNEIIEEIIEQSPMSTTYSFESEQMKDDTVTDRSSSTRYRTERLVDDQVTHQSSMSSNDSFQNYQIIDYLVTDRSAMSTTKRYQKKQSINDPVINQSSMSPTNRYHKEQSIGNPFISQSSLSPTDKYPLEQSIHHPLTHQSSTSSTERYQKEHSKDDSFVHQSVMSPTDRYKMQQLTEDPVTYQSSMAWKKRYQRKQCFDDTVTNQSSISPAEKYQSEQLIESHVSRQSAMSPFYRYPREQLSYVALIHESSVSSADRHQHQQADKSKSIFIKTSQKWRETVKRSTSMSKSKIHALVIQTIKDGKYKQKIIPIDIWDFGGQKDYYMTHQLFISSRGIYVLMFNGSVDLHKIINDPSFLPGNCGRPTVAVYLLHWVNSILTYCRRTDDGFPRIIFVATHKDKIQQNQIESRRNMLMDSIDKLFKSHAGLKHLEFKPLIFINAKYSRDPEIGMIRNRLIKRAVEHPRWGEEMPTAWVPLELQLAEKVEEGTNIVSLQELEILNAQNAPVVLNPKQLNTFLKVQHSLGKLLYFNEAKLRDFIIINPAYMVDILRSVVTEKQFWPEGKNYADVLDNLQKNGRISRDEIYCLWNQRHFQHILPYKEHMLEMLVHLDILVPPKTTFEDITQSGDVSNNDYLVPCMITKPNCTQYLDKVRLPSKSILLSYTFIEEVIPPALSYRFLASLLTMWDLKIYKGMLMLFSDLAVVEVDENHDVTLQVTGNRVVVSLIHSIKKEDIAPSLASSIQECLTATVYRISEFYSILSSDGKQTERESKPTTSYTTAMPFNIEFGVFCPQSMFTKKAKSMCFLSYHEYASTRHSSWKCSDHNKTHKIKSLQLWLTEKIPLERCLRSCKGLGLELTLSPSYKHLYRVVKKLTTETCRKLIIHLGLSHRLWSNLQDEFQNFPGFSDNMMFAALVTWKRGNVHSTFMQLKEALLQCDMDEHILCQAFRDITPDTHGLTEEILNKTPSNSSLNLLSKHIGVSVVQLGVELGLDISEIEEIQYEYKNKLSDQTKEVLKRWLKQKTERPTVRTLVKAMHRIEKVDCIRQIKF